MSTSPFGHSTTRTPSPFPRWLQVLVLAAGLIFTAWELLSLSREFLLNCRRRR